MYLGDVLSGIDAVYHNCTYETEISFPSTDSRTCEKDSLFIAIDGTKRHGTDFVRDALENGAAVCVVTDAGGFLESGIPCVSVSDTRHATAVIWNNYYRRPAEKMRLVGVTGTNGKTSTVHFLRSIFERCGRRAASIGTLGVYSNEKYEPNGGTEIMDTEAGMTTPDPKYLYGTLAKLRDSGVTDCIMEVSSHSILQRRIDALEFDAGVFTNLSPEHLDCHGTMEEYFGIKASFFDRCRKTVTNLDDEYGKRLSGIGYSIRDISSLDMKNGVSYTLHIDGRDIPIKTPLTGIFTVYNTLAAAVCAYYSGICAEDITSGILSAGNVPGRMERAVNREEFGFDVYIDYAHTPAALESVLTELRKCTEGQLVCVFGCGGDRDRTKRPEMGRIAAEICDKVIVTSDNPRNEDRFSVIAEILSGTTKFSDKILTVPDRREAILTSVLAASERDVILLAGKGHEQYEIENDKKTFFSEKEILKEALQIKFGK